MYKLILSFNGMVMNEKTLGSWRDNAREQFAKVRRAIEPVQGKQLELTLYTPDNEIELKWESK